jgi:hypothetical protein
MRRFLVHVSLLALLAASLPGSVLAAPATKVNESAVVLSCDLPATDGFVSVLAFVSPESGAFGDFAFWADPATPYEDPPSIVASIADVSGDATAMAATFDLVEFDESQEPPFGDPAGTATLSADLSPDGDPFTVDDRYRNGNRWERYTGSIQPLLADGSLVFPGHEITDLSGCYGATQDITYFSTNPSAFNDRYREFFVSCGWESGEDFVGLYARRDAFGSYGDVFISTPTSEIGGFGDATLTDTSLALAVELMDFNAEVAVGSAEARASLASSGTTIRTTETYGQERLKVVATGYSVDGSLVVTIDGTTTTYPMDDESCFAADQRVAIHAVRPNGPKPGPLANDTPDGAVPARLGHTIRLVTGGNAFEPEAPCTVVYPEEPEPVEIPISYTAWWTATGTGVEMSADTAGSDFDTVAGVYVMGGGGLEQIACVDDVFDETFFSLQAKVAWPSDAGTTYYLQVGGFGGDAGRLQLVVR